MRSFSGLAPAVLIASALLTGLPGSAAAQAPDWGNRHITLVVTYPPGGGADVMARLIAPKMGEVIGRNVVVENRPGASGTIAAGAVAKAAPDGHTIMLDALTYAVNPALYPNLPYDPDKAFRTIAVLALYPNVLVTNPGFSAKSAAEVVALAKAKPGAIAYASSGNGSAQHLSGVLFEIRANVDLLHVPYKGGGPAMADVMAGEVPLFFANVASGLQHIKAGKLRPLAVTSNHRAPSLPDVPTMAEAGIAGYEVYEWNVIVAPAGTNDALLARFSDAINKALSSPDVAERIQTLGGERFNGDRAAAERFIRDQTALWGKLVKERSIKPE